jgi:hypothetical protein
MGKKKDVKLSIFKYFQSHESEFHKYTRAYLMVEYRDIMKTDKDWDDELKTYMEGKR